MSSLRFLHIPKTAGTTFIDIMKRQYHLSGHFDFTGDIDADTDRFAALSHTEREKIGLFVGHAPITTGIKEADAARIITFLRDPVSRVKSYCQHAFEGKSPNLIDDFPPDSFDLDKFLDCGDEELSNMHSRMLINDRVSAASLLIEGMSDSEARDMALDNLFNKISYFGIVEYFEESVIYFKKQLNWSYPFFVSMNKKDSTKLIEFKERHIEKIVELNSIDIEVYDAAKSEFMSIIQSSEMDKLALWQFKLMLPAVATYRNNLPRIRDASTSLRQIFIPLRDKATSGIERFAQKIMDRLNL